MSLYQIPAKYPIAWTFGGVVFVGLPQWFQSVWSIFTTDAPYPVIRDWLKTVHITLPQFSPYWVTVPIGLLMFGWLAYELRLQRVAATLTYRVNEPIQTLGHKGTRLSLAYHNASLRFFNDEKRLHVEIIFENTGDEILRFQVIEVLVYVNNEGVTSPQPIININIQPREKRTYHFDLVGLSEINPSVFTLITLGFTAHYDNIPPIRKRYCTRHITWHYSSLVPLVQNRENVDKEDDGFVDSSKNTGLPEKESKDAVLLRLVQLRSEGVAIRNEAQKMLFTSHLDAWTTKVTDWMKEVIETLKIKNAIDSEWFATLGEVPQQPRVPIPNLRLGGQTNREMFVAIFCQHDFRLARLDKLLTKYGVGA